MGHVCECEDTSSTLNQFWTSTVNVPVDGVDVHLSSNIAAKSMIDVVSDRDTAIMAMRDRHFISNWRRCLCVVHERMTATVGL